MAVAAFTMRRPEGEIKNSTFHPFRMQRRRAEMKALIREWDKRFPGRVENMFNALSNIVPSHLMDHKLFPFAGLRASGEADPQGDIAFDEEPCSTDAGRRRRP